MLLSLKNIWYLTDQANRRVRSQENHIVQYSTIQYSTVQCSAVQYSKVQYSKVIGANILQWSILCHYPTDPGCAGEG